KKTIKYVSNNIYSDPSYKDFNTSQKLPFSFDYIHLMGGFKRSYSFCTLIAKHLRSENAHMYYRIIKRTLESKVKTHNIFYQKGNLFYFEKICNEIKEAPFSKKNQWLVNDNLANEYINGIINFERGKHFFKKPVMEDFLYIKFNSSKFIYKVNDHKPYILGLDQYSPLLTRKYDLDFLGVLIVKNSQKQITFSKLIKSIKIHFQINNNSELYTFINFVNTKLKEFYFIGAIELKNP
ncbi:DUF6734 family protein, partial [Runella limosa]|uniref:DUF6734 family protein n=1 Tax=Runella limosa TaxID=370978 RepID=UPI00146FA746